MYGLSQSGARLVSAVRISEEKGIRFSEVSNVFALRYSFNPFLDFVRFSEVVRFSEEQGASTEGYRRGVAYVRWGRTVWAEV